MFKDTILCPYAVRHQNGPLLKFLTIFGEIIKLHINFKYSTCLKTIRPSFSSKWSKRPCQKDKSPLKYLKYNINAVLVTVNIYRGREKHAAFIYQVNMG
jgi:hypothetical protein